MKTCLKALVLLVIISFISVACTHSQDAQPGSGDSAADFKLQDLNGDGFILSTYKGKQPVLLFFWTTWCPFCRNELAVLNDMYVRLTKKNWEVLAIDAGESPRKVRSFINLNPLLFKVLLDEDASVASAYKIIGIPTYILVDKEGYIVFKGNSFPREKFQELIKQQENRLRQ